MAREPKARMQQQQQLQLPAIPDSLEPTTGHFNDKVIDQYTDDINSLER
jgi:hypothetical protein